jgi:hypothetical protein
MLHIIEKPDSLGLACNVIQHGIILPMPNATVPTPPNYHLGKWVGSACDTLVSYQSAVSSEQVKVYPNPAQDRLTIEIPALTGNYTCVFYNPLGQKVYETEIMQSVTQVLVGNWGKGVYFYEVSTNNKKEYGKIFIE